MTTAERPQDAPDPAALRMVQRFDEVFHREYPRMVALAAAVSGDRSVAEDIAQEALSRLDREWLRLHDYQKPGAWVRRVTINLALSRRRRLATEARTLVRLRPRQATLPPSAAEHEPVWAAVAALPGKQRAAVALRYLEDRDISEIADILDIAPATARVHLHRAKQTLRAQLRAFDPTEETVR